MRLLYVCGVCLRGEGYPNAWQTLRALRESGAWEIKDLASWLPEHVHLWRVSSGPWPQRLALLARLAVGSAASLVRVVLALRRRRGMVYAPYPAIFLLWWASWLPRRLRPEIVADAYLSVWDSAFRDRAASRQNSWLARCVHGFERRALGAASIVLTDTAENQAWMEASFGLAPGVTRSLPLAIDQEPFSTIGPPRCDPSDRPLEVLFVGTLVPLHGVEVIAGCMELLGPECGIRFTVIGTGQQAYVLEEMLRRGRHADFVWRQSWATSEVVAQAIASSDVCLGVFGGEGKAARVLPFKLYAALCAGRPIVTQHRMGLPQGLPIPPCIAVDADPLCLAEALRTLEHRRETLAARGELSREYFERHLGKRELLVAWEGLAGRAPASPP